MVEWLLQATWWIPSYGLFGAVVTLPWSVGVVRRTGQRPAAYFNILMTFLALVHSSILLAKVWHQPAQELSIHWLKAADLDLTLALELSPTSVGAMVLVTSLSLLAQVFALGYMEKDWSLARFYGLMGFFEGAMSGLALSGSLLLSYALLEMLTLSTYLLVGFWYAQPLVVTAARDAFLTKRVGDVLLLMSVVALGTFAGSLNFNDLETWAQTTDLSPWILGLIAVGLIAGPIGKCAQFPLHFWLDEAMEGPNPASILRNSVVVACGAYVLIKVQPLVILSPVVVGALLVLGTMTAVGASLVALAQIDIKRAMCHSTSAYLGLVFMAVAIQQPEVALNLLLAHAVAKALIFMSIGSLISTTITQDLTEMGGIGSRMPATITAFIVGSLGMVAFLPLSGFWAMLQLAAGLWRAEPWLLSVLLLVNGLSVVNVVRVFRLVFTGSARLKTRRTPEVAWLMAVPMVSLSVIVLILPFLVHPALLLTEGNGWNPWLAAGLLVASSVIGGWVGFSLNLNRTWARPIGIGGRFFQDLLAYDFYVDKFYRQTIVVAVSRGSEVISWIDRYCVDGLVNLISLTSLTVGEALRYTTSGRSQVYMLTIVIGIALLGTWMWLMQPT